MHVLVYLPLVLPALAGLSARWLSRRLEPRTATWLLTGSALLLAAASGAALALLAATLLGQIPVLAALGDWSATVLRRNDPVSLSLSLVACAALVAALVAVSRAALRRVKALVDAAHIASCLPATRGVVVLADSDPDAYAVPGWPGRIVVTDGMLAALDGRERCVVLAHERAHLACGHHVFVALAALAAAANPLLRPVATAVRYTTERWADELAAREVGDRGLVARTVGKAALLVKGRRHGPSAVLAMVGRRGRALPERRTGSGGRLRGTGPVPWRVAALLAAPAQPNLLLLTVALAVLLLTGACTLDAARDLHGLFELAQGS